MMLLVVFRFGYSAGYTSNGGVSNRGGYFLLSIIFGEIFTIYCFLMALPIITFSKYNSLNLFGIQLGQ